MSRYKERSEYFKQLAIGNKLLSHNRDLGSGFRHTFFSASDDLASCLEGLRTGDVVLVHDYHVARFSKLQGQYPKRIIMNRILVLGRKNMDGDGIVESDAIDAAQERAEIVLNQLIAYMLEEQENNESGLIGELFYLDMAKAIAEPYTFNDMWHGWKFSFEDTQKAVDIVYNPQHWY